MRFALRLNSRTTKSADSSTAIAVPSSLFKCLEWHEPSRPYGSDTIALFPSALSTVPVCFEPTAKMVSNTSQGFSSNCLCPRLIRRFSLSNSRTTTSISSFTLQNSEGCLIFLLQLKSEMCTSPSMPSSNSTNKPKLVKFRTIPFCFEFTGYRWSISAQGSCLSCLSPSDILRSSRSMFKMRHSMSSPTLRKS